MSKPVTNVEIEDVLSSIRRLVSTSDRVERVEHEGADEVADKLVLTASFRVDEISDQDVETEKTHENQETETDSSSEILTDDGVLNSEIADILSDSGLDADEGFLEIVTDKSTAEDETRASDEDLSETVLDEDSGAEAAINRLDEIPSENEKNSLEFSAEADSAETAGDDAAATDLDRSDNLTHRAAEFETIVAEKNDQWDPDGTTQDDNAAISGGPVPWQEPDSDDADDNGVDYSADPLSVFDHATDSSENNGVSDTEDDGSAPVSEDETAVDETDHMATPGARPESDEITKDADLFRMVDEITPDEDSLVVEPAAYAFKAHDRSSPSDIRAPDLAETIAAQLEVTNAETPLPSEEALLDEDALRDIVSEIVRQELQGALGERITRNVRKLVRREIHRAFASQQIE